ncbi:MAG TPA: hypothetical protein DDW52_00865, partial [Planctomycetaceae bacterium]|nr:hypothetical protein [Planctomycetaceae bacterium]
LGAAALSDGDATTAIKHLATIVSLAEKGNPQAQELVAQIRLPLAQLYLAAGQSKKAQRTCLEILNAKDETEAATSIAKARQLTGLAISTVQSDRQPSELEVELLQSLYRFLVQSDPQKSPGDSNEALNELCITVSRALVNALCRRSEFEAAVVHLQHEITRSPPNTQAYSELLTGVQVAATQHYFQKRDFEKCRDMAKRIDLDSLDAAQQITIRIILLDCHFQARQLTSADEISNWFGQYFKEHDEATDRPSWYPTVQLRRAQVAYSLRKYSEALALVRSGLEQTSNESLRVEFRILDAKLAIAQVRFSDARAVLQQLTDELPRQSTQSQQVYWMTGELDFLQRRYAAAAEAYRTLVDSDAPAWKPLALVQLAKCHELLGDPERALSCYQQVAEMAQNAEAPKTATVARAIEQAKQRLAVIAANQPAEGQINR